MSEDIARRFGCECVRTKVGEVNVAERMMAEKSVIGGEGNGGVIDPRIHYGRDSLSGMALVLQHLAETGKSIGELVAGIPRYHMKKTKIECSRDVGLELVHRTAKEYAGEKVNTDDGVRIDWEDSWIHVRPSATEPAVRIIAEASSKERVNQLCDTFTRKAEALLKE
jgi:phosphomannomutase